MRWNFSEQSGKQIVLIFIAINLNIWFFDNYSHNI